MEEKQRYLRWLGILCVIMAAFCLGVFAIGYKDPTPVSSSPAPASSGSLTASVSRATFFGK